MIYPNSVAEFRILVNKQGEQILQLRYVSPQNGYTGKWQNVPIVKEEVENEQS